MIKLEVVSRMNIYKVEKAKLVYDGGVIEKRYFITENKLPMQTICQWLDNVSIESTATGKRYAYCLVGFLRYLDTLGISFKEVRTKTIIWNYIKKLMYEDKKANVVRLEGQKSHNSIYHNIGIICSFYLWLDEYKNGVINEKEIKNFRDIDSKYFYSSIWGTKYFKKKGRRSSAPFRMNYKRKRDSHRWYADEELECFMNAFNTKRDLAIFLIGVEGGCRIEEILTIKHYDYSANECKVWISESKTITRDCYLPQYVCDILNDYLNTEKFDLELKQDKQFDEYLFVNLKGKSQGEKVDQDNYRKILKRAGKRIGLNPSKIITHAGRSTKAQTLIEQGFNDFEIMEIMGWSSINTVETYRKQFSPKFSKQIHEKIIKRKRNGDNKGES